MEQNQVSVGERSTSELCDLAATGLVAMLDPDKQIFCDIYNRTDKGMIRERLSPRYTMMTLLGLHRYELSGRRSPVAIAPILDALLHDTGWIRSAGDLGLLLWTCAELVPGRLPEVYEAVGTQGALARFSDGQQGHTMEVAWYLTGIAELLSCRSQRLAWTLRASQDCEPNSGRELRKLGSLWSPQPQQIACRVPSRKDRKLRGSGVSNDRIRATIAGTAGRQVTAHGAAYREKNVRTAGSLGGMVLAL